MALHPLVSLMLSLTILAVLMKKIQYGYALIIVSALFIATFSPEDILSVFLRTITSWETIELALMILLVSVLAYIMRELGEIDDFISEISKFISPKKSLVVLPAFLGLLPIPGGAIMSAPLIERSSKGLNLERHVLAFSNIWFRHIVMPVFPLTPSIIVIANITGMNIYNFILHMIPFFLIMTLVGYLFLRGVSGSFEKTGRDLKKIVISVTPIVIPVLTNALGLNLLSSIILGILVAIAIKRPNSRKALELLKDGLNYNLFFAVVGIMYFKNALDASSFVPFVEDFVNSSGIPLWILCSLVSALIGVIFGAMMAGVAISVSILHPFIDANMMYLCLLFASSLLAYLLSPMHLCNIVTFEYFHNDVGKFYRYMMPSSLATFLLSLPIILSYGKIGWI